MKTEAQPLNILILTYQGDTAGSTNSIAYLSKGLAEKGHNVYVGCRKESLLFSMLSGSKVNLCPMTFRSKVDLQNIRQIRDVVNRHHIQIINAQSSKDRYTSIFSKWLYGLNVKVIHTRRQKPESIGGFLQNWFYVKGTDKIVAVSGGVKKFLIDQKIPEKHIKIIHNGTPLQKYDTVNSYAASKLKRKYNLLDTDFVIGCVSRKKNQDQILRALVFVPFKTKVIFVGIEKYSDYQKHIEVLKGRHDIYFTGLVSNEEVLNYYPLFTIKILPSNMEGLSQSILEAMALGIPVIATDAAGNPDIVKHQENGLLFRDNEIEHLAQSIILVHDNPSIRQKLIKNGRKTALETFSMEKTIHNYESFFHSLLEN